METDQHPDRGEVGIPTQMVQPDRKRSAEPDEPAPQVEPGATMIYKAAAPVATQAVSAAELGLGRDVVELELEGDRRELTKRRAVLGRSRDCDIQLSNPNFSRRHVEHRQEVSAC